MPPRDTPSLARDWFQGFLHSSDKVAFLRGLVNSNPLTFETEWLEFKPYPHANPDETIKEIWSKNLSAFGNTAGGVLIWGIGARKVRKVDAARSIQFVPNPDELRTRLYELHHQATDPPLPGIDVQAVSDFAEGGKGFIVCFIPQGEFVPYRAEYSGSQYYVRVGDDSIVPNRVVLRRMFYPQSLAKLRMMVSLRLTRKTSGSANITEMDYSIVLVNDGFASAHDVYVVAVDNVDYPVTGRGLIHSENWASASLSPNKSMFHARIPIHPGFSTQVAASHKWDARPQYVVGNTVYPDFRPLWMKFYVYSRDTEYQAFRVDFVKEDLLQSNVVERACNRIE